MVFFVGTKTRRTWSISSLEFGSDYDIGDGTEIQMVFRFANNDLVKVDGTVNTTTETVSFLTPTTLFTADRKGPVRHTLRIKESGATGIDNLTIPIEEQVKDNVATPAEIDDIT